MKHTINLPHNAGIVELDFAELPEATRHWIIAYGMRQGIVDAASGAAKYAADAKVSLADAVNALCGKRIEAMKKGEVGMRGQANPLRAELIRIIGAASPAFKKLDKADQIEKADAIINGAGSDAAKAMLAEAQRRIAKAAPADIDLGL